jgi:hypothetical protein
MTLLNPSRTDFYFTQDHVQVALQERRRGGSETGQFGASASLQ